MNVILATLVAASVAVPAAVVAAFDGLPDAALWGQCHAWDRPREHGNATSSPPATSFSEQDPDCETVERPSTDAQHAAPDEHAAQGAADATATEPSDEARGPGNGQPDDVPRGPPEDRGRP